MKLYEHIDIETYAQTRDIDYPQAERDIYLTCLLMLLSVNRILPKIVFKGGTCLSKMYFKKWRISQDLDFTLRHSYMNEDIYNELVTLFSSHTSKRTFGDITFSIVDKSKNDETINLELKYKRLKDIGITIEVQISLRDDVIYDGYRCNMIYRNYFQKIENFMGVKFQFPKIMCLHPYEVISEKLRAADKRLSARDLFDTWLFLDTEEARQLSVKRLLRKLFIMKLWSSFKVFNWQKMVDGVETASQDWRRVEECTPRYLWDKIPDVDIVKEKFLKGYQFLRKLTNDERTLISDAKNHQKKKLYEKMRREITGKLKRLGQVTITQLK